MTRSCLALLRLGIAVGLLAWLAQGCQSTQLGQCDQSLAETVVFDLNGNPAFAGQAMVEQECSGCHASSVRGRNRRGTPVGFDFDMVGSRSADPSMPIESSITALLGSREVIFESRIAMFDTVAQGTMPPGLLGLESFIDAGYRYPAGRRLEPINSAEGTPLYRNWLACNGPVVERTGNPVTTAEAGTRCNQTSGLGTCVYRSGQALPVDPTWTSISTLVLRRNCGGSVCHGDGDEAGAALHLLAETSLQALLNVPATSDSDCRAANLPRIAPGNPTGSLLYDKLLRFPEAEDCPGYTTPVSTCGEPMPPGGGRFVGCNALDAVRQWISNGATE